jgi:hypothetical protein
MINKIIVPVPIPETTKEEVVSITCDVCKKVFKYSDKMSMDTLEIQEFTHIGFTGGYQSVFGDMVKLELDICQHCLKEKLGESIRKVNLNE